MNDTSLGRVLGTILILFAITFEKIGVLVSVMENVKQKLENEFTLHSYDCGLTIAVIKSQ